MKPVLMGGFRYPGWTCGDPFESVFGHGISPFGTSRTYVLDDGTLARTQFPTPGHITVDAIKAAELDEDKKEFNLLKGKITDLTVEAYVKHREKFFGSRAEYKLFALDSDKELDGTKGLRRLIEFDKKPKAQTVFYRWVRKAYMDAGATDVPKLIKAGKSEELKAALADVKVKSGQAFTSGGFNPRPKKDSHYRYRLGTLSEHATGKAIDIEDDTNPIISIVDWKFMETLCDKKVNRGASRWKDKPKELWTDVKDLSDAFVTKVAAEVKRINGEREAAAKAANTPAGGSGSPAAKPKPPPPLKPPIDEVLAGHATLKPWINGFFTLAWPLVEQLHKHDFLWGATFSNAIDLHHFELD